MRSPKPRLLVSIGVGFCRPYCVAVAEDPAGNLKPAKDSRPSASTASSPSSWRSAAPWSPRRSRSPSTPCSLSERGIPRVWHKDAAKIIRAFDEFESYRLPVSWNVAPRRSLPDIQRRISDVLGIASHP